MKFVALALILVEACSAQSGDTRAKKVIADAVEALGGDRFLSMEDRVESGRAYSFYRDQITGLSIAKIYTRYLTVATGKTGIDIGVREKQAFGKAEDSSVLFREDGAWDVSFRGARPLDQDRINRYHDTTLRNIFYIFRMRLKEPGMIFESRGADVIDNQPVEIVDITDSENRLVTVYFHQSTKLPVRQSWIWRDPKTKERNEEITLFNKYRDAGGGIQWPFQIQRDRNGDKVYEIFSDSVTINQNLSDSAFAEPAAVAAPPKPVTPSRKK
jgi:hypothetical protein